MTSHSFNQRDNLDYDPYTTNLGRQPEWTFETCLNLVQLLSDKNLNPYTATRNKMNRYKAIAKKLNVSYLTGNGSVCTTQGYALKKRYENHIEPEVLKKFGIKGKDIKNVDIESMLAKRIIGEYEAIVLRLAKLRFTLNEEAAEKKEKLPNYNLVPQIS